MSGISINGIAKRFGSTAVLADITMEIGAGEFVTLVGPSGCGKSTLLRIIAGLEVADRGEIRIGGRPVDHLRPKDRDVAMVFQSYALYPYMTAFQNMALPLVMRRLSRWQRFPVLGRMMPGTRDARRRIATEVHHVAQMLSIAPLLERKPAALSGGQRQRVALGRAMVRQPAVFLMDEPLSNLDAKLRVQMRAEIAELHRRLGVTFLYVTHDQAEAMTMSDRVAVMIEGELLQVSAPQRLYADPDHLKVAELIGSPKINTLPATVRRDGGVELAGLPLATAVAQPPGAELTVGFRADAFEVVRAGRPGSLAGTIVHIEHLGLDVFVHCRLEAAKTPVVIRLAPAATDGLDLGHEVGLVPAAERALLFDADGARLRPKPLPALREVVGG